MLGLAHQIQRNPVRIIVAIRDDQNFGRTRDHVDADLTENTTLGGCNKGVSGSGDLINRLDRFGAIGQRRDRLRATDAVNLIHAGQARRQQNQRIDNAVRRGNGNCQTANARHLRRNGVHQNGRRIRGQAARHIKTRRRNRRPTPTKLRACGVGPHRVLGHLTAVVGADAFRCQFQCRALFVRHFGDFRVNLCGRDCKPIRCQLHPVEFGRQFQNRRVAACADIGNDVGHDMIHVRAVFPLGA